VNRLVDAFQSALFRRAMLEAVVVGAVAGLVGVHVVLRRLPFFVTAMSHATFPGIVIASTLGFSLFLGGASFGLVVVAVVLILGAERALDDTAVIAVVLAGSFAIGMMILSTRPSPSTELSEILVGSVLTVSRGDIAATLVVGAVVVVLLGATHKELVLGAFDPTAAAAMGYPTRGLDGLLLVCVTLTLVAAIPAVGTLLAIALLTVPALTARLWTDRLGPTMALATVLGATSAVLGLCAAALWSIAAGGAIALATGVLFVSSLALTRSSAAVRGAVSAKAKRRRRAP
jgi:ABC-type Mn2+/Zn2+ transport system permease subunit